MEPDAARLDYSQPGRAVYPPGKCCGARQGAHLPALRRGTRPRSAILRAMRAKILKTRPVFLLIFVLWLAGCQPQAAHRQVVVYTSVDQVFAEPVLQEYEKSSGIDVLAVYDVEATKTVGLVQRLVAEKSNPRADVFWNNEFSQTLFLKEQGVLATYDSPAAANLPENFRDPDRFWSAFGGRARVILVNTERVKSGDEPDSVFSLLDPRYSPDQVGMANPLFGTTLTHSAALYAALGQDQAGDLFQRIANRGVQILDGNSVVRDRVADGQLAWGLTDTDDACGALVKGAPVKAVFPDQAADQVGTLLIPNTVALVASGPNPENGKALIDYLLSLTVEAALIKSGSIQIPSRPLPPGAEQPCFADLNARGMTIGFDAIFRNLAPAEAELRELFIK